ncbi:cytochrome b [Arsenicitalea aurantiaca]|uniref:Cytochrome b n=1 Tax=Arsenicitalea aurantiaca TaxID=1783274 RepID=A0A433X3E4_9HYPH|nr:cytochrome b [Arsenicitalea aurantiaca]RUT28571.1 cytochrome b [Arsenicitalea aurantiaca]
MSRTDQAGRYHAVAIFLHWLMALFILTTIPVGIIMAQEGLPRDLQDRLFLYHKNIGVVLLLLVAVRIAFRAFNPPPPFPASMPRAQRLIAAFTHYGLYLLVIVMGVSGYIYVIAGGFPIEGLNAIGFPRLVGENEALSDRAHAIHSAVRFPLVLLVLLHVGAALYHLAIKRDGVFQRMLPGRR